MVTNHVVQLLKYVFSGCYLSCNLAGLVAPLRQPVETLDDPGAPGSTRKKTLGSRLRFLSIRGSFRHPILKAFGATWTNICVFVRVRFQVLFWKLVTFVFQRLEFKNKHLGLEVFQSKISKEAVF